MSRWHWLAGLCIIGVAVLCGWVIRGTAGEPAAGSLDRLLDDVAFLRAANRPMDSALRERLWAAGIRASLRSGKSPARAGLDEVLPSAGPGSAAGGAPGRPAIPPAREILALWVAGGLAGLAAIITLLGLVVDLRRLRRAHEQAGRDLVVDRRHALVAASGLAVAGCLACGFTAYVARQPPAVVVREAWLNALMGVLLLPVSAWAVGLVRFWRTERVWASAATLPLGAIAAAGLMAGWGAFAGAWPLRFGAAGLVLWFGLSYALSQLLLERADFIAAHLGAVERPPAGEGPAGDEIL